VVALGVQKRNPQSRRYSKTPLIVPLGSAAPVESIPPDRNTCGAVALTLLLWHQKASGPRARSDPAGAAAAAARAPTSSAGRPCAALGVRISSELFGLPLSHWPRSCASCRAAHCSCGGEVASMATTHCCSVAALLLFAGRDAAVATRLAGCC
jgi:hypothetical protein